MVLDQYACRGLCTRNVSRAVIERPYSREPQAVGAVYDRPGFFVQSRGRGIPHDAASLSRPDARRPLAMSIFVALYLSGAAFASALETAGVARSALSVFPLRKASTARSRYGLPAMPPNTTRASSMVLSLNCKPRAADAMAKSQTPRGLSFSNEARKPGFGGGMTISVRISLKRTTCDWMRPSTIMSPGTSCSTDISLIPEGPATFTVASSVIRAGAASPG